MASHGKTEYGTAKGNDYAEHEWTYDLFVQIVKWSVITSAVIMFFMYWFLT